MKTCRRCHTEITDTNYHDGSPGISSPNNQRDITGTADGFIELCNPCYWQYHDGFKAWLAGVEVRVVQRLTRV